MKLKVRDDSLNYTAIVVKITNLFPLEGLDNLQGTSIYGNQILVGKDVQAGDVGLFFPSEVRLSDKYCSENNLFRHPENNVDKTKKGFIEDNGRVKAIKFRGHTSTGLFMPVTSLAFIGHFTLELGSEFNEIDGVEICRKYVKRYNQGTGTKSQIKAVKLVDLVDTRCMPEHVDTQQLFRNMHKLGLDDIISVTTKLHGTSFRVGNTPVYRRSMAFQNLADKAVDWFFLPKKMKTSLRAKGIGLDNLLNSGTKRLLGLFGIEKKEYDYKYVCSSRRVVKSVGFNELEGKQHYYEDDLWTKAGAHFKDKLHKGEIIFAEIVGWNGQKPIQQGYTYSIPEGGFVVVVYRIAMSNPDGVLQDLSWPQLKERCAELQVNHVPEIYYGRLAGFIIRDEEDGDLLNNIETKKKDNLWWANLEKLVKEVYLDKPSVFNSPEWSGVEEGIVIQKEKLGIFEYYKAKSPQFLLHESNLLDNDVVDMEVEESNENNESAS